MRSTTRYAALLLFTTLPMTTLAQTDGTATEAEPPAPTEETTAEGTIEASPPADPSAGLSTGQVVPQAGTQQGQQAAEPQLYVREEHGAFEVRCLRAPEGQDDPCQLFQRLSDAEGNPTADINFFDLPAGSELPAGATIITPLQTLLTAGVSISIDGGEARRYPFSFCDAAGCYARLGFSEEDLGLFRLGANAQVIVVPAVAPDQPAQLTMSLAGFTAGIAAVEVADPQ